MTDHTEYQEEVLNKFYDNGSWTFPCCKSDVGYPPDVENAEDTPENLSETQVHCPYGCGYIFLENYIKDGKDKKTSLY